MGRKCQSCFVDSQEKQLKACSLCKSARYCSRECQAADWKDHKPQCQNNVHSARILAADSAAHALCPAPSGLPDGLTPQALHTLLDAWIRFHTLTLMTACVHAIRLADSYDHIHTRVLVLRLRPLPRAVHGGAAPRAFDVAEADACEADALARCGAAWAQSLVQLRTMQRRAARGGVGRFGAVMIECEPLGLQAVPFGTGPVRGPVQEDWREVLVEDVREGRRVTRLSRPVPLGSV